MGTKAIIGPQCRYHHDLMDRMPALTFTRSDPRMTAYHSDVKMFLCAGYILAGCCLFFATQAAQGPKPCSSKTLCKEYSPFKMFLEKSALRNSAQLISITHNQHLAGAGQKPPLLPRGQQTAGGIERCARQFRHIPAA